MNYERELILILIYNYKTFSNIKRFSIFYNDLKKIQSVDIYTLDTDICKTLTWVHILTLGLISTTCTIFFNQPHGWSVRVSALIVYTKKREIGQDRMLETTIFFLSELDIHFVKIIFASVIVIWFNLVLTY